MKSSNKKLAAGGIIGGILYMIATILVHTGAGMTGENPDPGWLSLPNMLCGISEILAVLGSVGLLAGFTSLYHMVKGTCGEGMRKLTLISAFGVVGMALFHGNIHCIEPLVYQVLQAGGQTDLYPAMDAMISGSFAPVDLLILVTFYLQLIVLFYSVLSGKAAVKKWLLVCNPISGLILGIILGAVLPSSANGIALGMRNLGEGFLYIIPYMFWKSANI